MYIHGIATANEKVKDRELSMQFFLSLYFALLLVVFYAFYHRYWSCFFPSYAVRFICNANRHGGKAENVRTRYGMVQIE